MSCRDQPEGDGASSRTRPARQTPTSLAGMFHVKHGGVVHRRLEVRRLSGAGEVAHRGRAMAAEGGPPWTPLQPPRWSDGLAVVRCHVALLGRASVGHGARRCRARGPHRPSGRPTRVAPGADAGLPTSSTASATDEGVTPGRSQPGGVDRVRSIEPTGDLQTGSVRPTELDTVPGARRGCDRGRSRRRRPVRPGRSADPAGEPTPALPRCLEDAPTVPTAPRRVGRLDPDPARPGADAPLRLRSADGDEHLHEGADRP